MPQLISRLGRVALALGLLASLLSGCGDDADTVGFDIDPAPIDPDLTPALEDGADPDAVPAVQRNFLDACVKGFDDSIPELEPVQRAGLLQVCGCTYERLIGHVYELAVEPANQRAQDPTELLAALDEVAWELFQGLEDDLRSGESITTEVRELIRSCITEESGLS